MNLKMKRTSVGFDQSRATDGEAKEKLKYQTLLKEYLELQKEYVSRKRKLQAAKQKRELCLAEVRFLKRRHKHLSKSQAPNADRDLLHQPNMDLQTSTIDQLLLSNSRPKDEEAGGGDRVYEEDVRRTKKIKNHVTQGKGESKRKICWPDQVTLNV